MHKQVSTMTSVELSIKYCTEARLQRGSFISSQRREEALFQISTSISENTQKTTSSKKKKEILRSLPIQKKIKVGN